MITSSSSPRGRSPLAAERGMSLIEVLVGIIVLSIGLIGVALSGSMANRQMRTGRTDMTSWAALQQQAEVLVRQGFKNVKTDSSVVLGYPLNWTVSGTDPKQAVLVMKRTSPTGAQIRDTLILYFAARDTL
ncbi:MAG: type IV pilus modification PilV family protein [Gemmatimonadales bacterium]